mgnify:CR=1 FL=1
MGSDHRDGHDRRAAEERESDGAGLGPFRPLSGVAGGSALREDTDGLTGGECFEGRDERVGGGGGASVNGDEAEPGDETAKERRSEDSGAGEEAQGAAEAAANEREVSGEEASTMARARSCGHTHHARDGRHPQTTPVSEVSEASEAPYQQRASPQRRRLR